MPRKLPQEIRSAGCRCETLAYDAREPAVEQFAGLTSAPTHAYYFATPAIFKFQPEIFAPERLKEFLAIYVDGFWQLAQGAAGSRAQVIPILPRPQSLLLNGQKG